MNKTQQDFLKNLKHLYSESNSRIQEVKAHLIGLLPFWIAGGITALVTTSYARIFLICEELSLKLFDSSKLNFGIISTICFFLSWILVEKYAPYANGSGIPQIMASVELYHSKKNPFVEKYLSLRVIIIKILSSLICVIGGGAIGREGPSLQISGSIFHLISDKWKLGEIKNKSAFLMAGAASGLASAFNTPLGGIVYVIEELAKSHLSSFRTGVLHSVIIAGIISQLLLGPYLYFGYPKIVAYGFNDILKFILIAIFSALMVTFFSQILKQIVLFRKLLHTFKYKVLFTLFIGVLFAVTTIWISKSPIGPGKNLLNELLFKEKNSDLVDVFVRLIGTSLTYASGGAGGIFAPTLSLGGVTASYLSSIFDFNYGAIVVLVGMTSGLAALTHSPLTSFILILEMTDRHSSIFPLMISAVIGHGISKLISKISFYEFVTIKILSEIKEEK